MALRAFGTTPPNPRLGAFQPGGTGAVRTRGDVPVPPGAGSLDRVDRGVYDAPAVVEPVEPKPFAGSPLNTLYGIDNESYLTDDQRKLARMIQGKFDASVNRRDRELARYGAPRLSSFAEDESLARAMSLARGLNFKEPVVPDPYGQGANILRPGGTTAPGSGGYPRTAPPPAAPTPDNGAKTNAQWQRILAGLASIAPLLFGKDAYGQFLNRGLLGTIKEKLFGPGASSTISDAQLEQIVQNGGLPEAGGMAVNPLTGLPIAPGAFTPGDIYGPGSGWDQDVLNTPGFTGGTLGDWWNDGNLGSGVGSDWWSSWTPDSGGDWLDIFGGA